MIFWLYNTTCNSHNILNTETIIINQCHLIAEIDVEKNEINRQSCLYDV